MDTPEPTSDLQLREEATKPAWRRWARWAVMLLAFVIVGFFLSHQGPIIKEGFAAIRKIKPGWLTLSIVAALVSMVCAAGVQRTLLHAAEVPSRWRDNLVLIFAANSWSTSVPGGQVIATLLTFRETKRWGAAKVVATWQILFSGVLSIGGLAAIGLLGFFLVGTTANPVGMVLSIVLLVAVVAAAQWASHHVDELQRWGDALLVRYNALRRRKADHGSEHLHDSLEQLRVVKLRGPDLAKAAAWSLGNWVADIVCLACAAESVSTHPSLAGLLIAYVTGKVLGSMPVTPGGLGTVEASLIAAFTLGGLPAAASAAAVFVYRAVSFFLITAVGWLAFLLAYSPASRAGLRNSRMSPEGNSDP